MKVPRLREGSRPHEGHPESASDSRTGRLSTTGTQKRLSTVASKPLADGDLEIPKAEAPSQTEPRLVFLLSTERAGSTLLSLMLGAHPRIVAPPELHLMAYSTFEAWQHGYPDAMDSLSTLLESCGLPADSTNVVERFAGWTPEAIYRWILDEQLGDGRILIDKTPKYARDPAVLRRLESLSPHYLWLIRHPLDVAASQITLRRNRRARRGNGRLERLKYPLFLLRERMLRARLLRDELAYWRSVNGNISDFLGRIEPARSHRVSFESLVREPERAAAALCQWLGIELDPAMLNPQEHVPERMGPLIGDPKIRSHRRIDPNVVGSWRRFFSPDDVDATTRELMHTWGVGDA